MVELLLNHGSNPNAEVNGGKPIFLAIESNQLDIVKALVNAGSSILNIARSSNGHQISALALAKFHGHDATILYLQESDRAKSTKKLTALERDYSLNLTMSLAGLEGLDSLKQRLDIDLQDFIAGSESVGRLFFGEPGTGKTEVAQRLCGMREGYPGLKQAGINAVYVSGVDGRFEIKKIIDDIAPHSIIFIDEADKCLDPGAGMVSAADAIQLHHALVTHFGRKPIYWGLVGTFSALRGGAGREISHQALEKTLGRELASRLDYIDWCFHDWPIENLLRAARATVAKRGLQYDDEALLMLANHCLSTGGALRSFDNIDRALGRQFCIAGWNPENGSRVSADIAGSYLMRFMPESS